MMSDFGTQTLQAQLARYTLKERIGAGGMATVYRAWDKNLERDVAIKVLHEHLSFDNTFQERFVREAKFVAGFHHPHIVQIFDFAMIETKEIPVFYMVMPYMTGDTLATVIANQRDRGSTVEIDRVINVIDEIASALDYAHKRGMVHRDVKPANILYDDHDRAMLTDFGIARLAETNNLTAEGLTIGTPAYMPPEQAQGIEVDHRADIYSLGGIAYELLTGKPPYGEGSISVMLEHINADIPLISDSMAIKNYALDSVFKRVLAKDPAARYQSASEFSDAFKQAIQAYDVVPKSQVTKVLEPIATEVRESADVTLYPDKPKRVEKASSNAPLGFIAMGLGLLAFALIVALLSQMPESAGSIIESTTPASDVAESMTGEQFFDMSFVATDVMLEYWDQSDSEVMVREVNDGKFFITNNRANTATTTLFDPAYEYDNVTITMEAHLIDAQSSASGYGIVFRYQDVDNYNVFAVDGRGRFSIWLRKGGEWQELRNLEARWTEDAAINPDSDSNILRIEIYEESLKGYVNGVQVVQLDDNVIDKGAIGIYLATTRQGMAQVAVDNYAVKATVPTTSSMTDDSDNVSESMTDDG